MLPSSFRDPSGFLFKAEGQLLRQVNSSYSRDYDHLMTSGLYERLVDLCLLVPHEEAILKHAATDDAYKILRPHPVPFISYPHEWCFSQLKDVALATLHIQRMALDYGMSLKDASAYNIQFHRGKPTLIDTLSLQRYEEGKPWDAYRQFCQHFLGPLALMSKVDVRLVQLLRVHIDGVPLDLASRLLPASTRLSPSLLAHIHLHAKANSRGPTEGRFLKRRAVSKRQLLALVENLESSVRSLAWHSDVTEWSDYYSATNYTEAAMADKQEIVGAFLDEIQPPPKMIWDLGANTGTFSRIAARRAKQVISFDIDPACVELNYLTGRQAEEAVVLPLVTDLSNPTSSYGWANEERMSMIERGPADVVLALALVHHLAIANNLPFEKIATFLSRICRFLIIEFVPKEDGQVQRLLSTREDIFSEYNQVAFETSFTKYFRIRLAVGINDSLRRLYLLEAL